MNKHFRYSVENLDDLKQLVAQSKHSDTMPVYGNITLEVLCNGNCVCIDLRNYCNDDDTFVSGWVVSKQEFAEMTEADFNCIVNCMYRVYCEEE